MQRSGEDENSAFIYRPPKTVQNTIVSENPTVQCNKCNSVHNIQCEWHSPIILTVPILQLRIIIQRQLLPCAIVKCLSSKVEVD